LTLLVVVNYILLPFSYPVTLLLDKIKIEENEDENTREEEIEAFIEEGTREGIFETEESELIKGIMEFSDTIVREVMTPRIDIVSVEASTPLKDAIKIFAESRHTRLPVYEGQIDNLIGAIYIKDILNPAMGENSNSKVKEFMKAVPFVPENKPISQLLKEFQLNKEQLAIVVDEYGGVDGLVTTEDLLEEIVGEIEEIGEKEEKLINVIDEETVEVRGRASLKDLEEVLKCDIPEGDYDSVAGWIATKLGSIPHLGATFTIDNFLVKIVSADKKRIHKVIVKKLSGGENGKSDR
jgi:CBS domain containing-hemolysin-like protein